MSSDEQHSVRVVWECRSGHRHEMCHPVRRGVPPELRCSPGEPAGYGQGGGAGCVLPADLAHRIERELGDNFQESKRRGFVLVQ